MFSTCCKQLEEVPRLSELPGVLLSSLGLMKSFGIGLWRWEKMAGCPNLDRYLADLCNLIIEPNSS